MQNLTHTSTSQLKHLQSYIDDEYEGSEQKFNLLTRKGVYPYSHIQESTNFEEGFYSKTYYEKHFLVIWHIIMSEMTRSSQVQRTWEIMYLYERGLAYYYYYYHYYLSII